MRWLVADSLYCHEAFFCSHLDSYSHYLREFGEDATSVNVSGGAFALEIDGPDCVAFVLDNYGMPIKGQGKRIAQVAAICNPMPWDVRKRDGSPAYDLVISSIPWMIDEAHAKGCRGEYMPLAFDTRARACGMGVQRDLACIFVGTVGPNHVRRTQLLEELKDIVTVMPPVFGREYFKTLARARTVFNVHAEWTKGAANAMRLYEAAGMGAEPVSDGEAFIDQFWWGPNEFVSAAHARDWIMKAAYGDDEKAAQDVLLAHTYESRIPRLVELARSL